MNAYDFDGTIYRGNSSVDFFVYCMGRNLKVMPYVPSSLYGLAKYKLGVLDLTKDKLPFCEFATHIKNLDDEVRRFWDTNIRKIYPFFYEVEGSKDLIITSSPEFLISPLAEELGIEKVIGTRVDLSTGHIIGRVCNNGEKVRRFNESYGEGARINRFYTDSLEDAPLFEKSEEVYMLKKGIPTRVI